MSFTKVRQAAGQFSLSLRDDLPFSISQQLTMTDAGFAHLAVTPNRLPVDQIDWTTLRSLSIYTGVVRKRTNRTQLAGAHATIWLGDEDKKGNIEKVVSGTGQTFEWWIDALRKGDTASDLSQLDAGTVASLGGSYTASYNWDDDQVSRRDQIAEVCEWAGAVFRVNDDLTLDAGDAASVFGSTPTVVLTPTWEGRDSGYTSIRAMFDVSEDVEDWTSDVIYAYSGGVAIDNGTYSYLNGLGTDALWQRVISLDTTKSSTINAAIAASQLTRFQKIRQTLDVTTDADAVLLDVNPGETVYAWDPDNDVYDLTNQIYFRGDLIFPVELTVESVTMPAHPGLGIYLRRGDGTLIDLTDWYEPETGSSRLEVGERPQSLRAALRSRGLFDQS